jgi:hypothetical protein
MEQPGATGDWTFKDVVAHISSWRALALARLEAARQNQTPDLSFWPTGLDEDNDEELEQINQWIYQKNRHRTLSDVLNESRQQFRDLRQLMQALPETELFDLNRFEWMHGNAVADMANLGHFHEEHEPVLREWLAQVK